eukprot:Seg1812.6 transcript_id=Seg1812.6/GoldUCD/mRNA.D3Y31 product="Fibroblast growth factor 2" protein_id=Seg1812.6/GoldUCD/D3Y31
MEIFKMYQLLCCVVCCKLLFSVIPTTHARKKRTKSYQKYLASLKKANELLLNHNIEFEKLHALFNRLKKRVNKSKPRHRRKRNIHVNYSEHLIMPLPTNIVKCRIYCRSGLYLQLLPDGLVKGTTNQYDPHVFIELQSYGPSLVRIKGLYARRYLTIDRSGRLKAARNPKLAESLFKEVQEENSYNSYSSFKYFFDEPYDIFVGIRTTGQTKKTWKTYPGQLATQFLMVKS